MAQTSWVSGIVVVIALVAFSWVIDTLRDIRNALNDIKQILLNPSSRYADDATDDDA